MRMEGRVCLLMDGKEVAVWTNTIRDHVVARILDKVINNSDFDDGMVPTRIGIRIIDGANSNVYNLIQTVSSRSIGSDSGGSYVEFVAGGFYPSLIDSHKVNINQVSLMSETEVLAQANNSAGEIYPNPDIYYYQHVQVRYQITLVGAEDDWMEDVLGVMMGYEYMSSGNWRADNYRFVQPNKAKLFQDAEQLSETSFDLAYSANQQGSLRADASVFFDGVDLASGTPNRLYIYSHNQGSEELVTELAISIQGDSFNQGDSLLVPFSLYIDQ